MTTVMTDFDGGGNGSDWDDGAASDQGNGDSTGTVGNDQ